MNYHPVQVEESWSTLNHGNSQTVSFLHFIDWACWSHCSMQEEICWCYDLLWAWCLRLGSYWRPQIQQGRPGSVGRPSLLLCQTHSVLQSWCWSGILYDFLSWARWASWLLWIETRRLWSAPWWHLHSFEPTFHRVYWCKFHLRCSRAPPSFYLVVQSNHWHPHYISQYSSP